MTRRTTSVETYLHAAKAQAHARRTTTRLYDLNKHHTTHSAAYQWKTSSLNSPNKAKELYAHANAADADEIHFLVSQPATPATALRVCQLFTALPQARLLVMQLSSPDARDKLSNTLFRLRHSVQPSQFSGNQLKRGKKLLYDWNARLRAALSHEVPGVRTEVAEDGHSLIAWREGPIKRTGERPDASAIFKPCVLDPKAQLKELRARVDEGVEALPDVVLSPFGGGKVRTAGLVRSSAERYDTGGYSAQHYIKEQPSLHAAAYELKLGDEEAGCVGYISILAYNLSDTDCLPTAVGWRFLNAAQVERLVVLPAWRGSGAKEALLRTCGIFHHLGYAVRLKTGASAAAQSIARCPLLVYESHRQPDAMACGVNRKGRRKQKEYARVLPSTAMAREVAGGAATREAVATPDAAGSPRRIRALLNKMTGDNFERLLPQLVAAVCSEEALRELARLVAQRAVSEMLHSKLYCSALRSVVRELVLGYGGYAGLPRTRGELKAIFATELVETLEAPPRGASKAMARLVALELIQCDVLDASAASTLTRVLEPYCDTSGGDSLPVALALGLRCGSSTSVPIDRGAAVAPQSLGDIQLSLDAARRAAAEEMGLELVTTDASPERLRRLRAGWVFWFAAPVHHPEGKGAFAFDPVEMCWQFATPQHS